MRLPVTAVATFEAADRPHLTKKTGVDMAATPNHGIASPGDVLFLTDCRSMAWHGECPLLSRPGGTRPPARALPDQPRGRGLARAGRAGLRGHRRRSRKRRGRGPPPRADAAKPGLTPRSAAGAPASCNRAFLNAAFA